MYIRTKDGVYEVDENTKGTEDFLWVKTNKANIVQCVWLNCILKQSENLAELCDEFVIHRKEHNYNFVWNEERNIGLNYFCSFLEKYDVYGAVWVDGKGLIYVAKMNENGELELL